MLNLNCGCGKENRSSDEIGLDINLSCEPDVCANIEALPFKDRTFDQVRAIHTLEHIHNIVPALNEIYRILKWNGEFIVEVPEYPYLKAIADPTHVRYFIEETFHYFEGEHRLPGFKGSFEIIGIKKGQKNTPTEGNLICAMRKN